MNHLSQNLLETLKYVHKFSGETILIKVGGAALQNSELVSKIAAQIALLRSVGLKVILVHGGGPSINQELTLHGITWEFIEGQRVTTPEMMDVVEMTLSGFVNKRMVRTLNSAGTRAVGLSGVDGGLLQCETMEERLGCVGKIVNVAPEIVQTLLAQYTPVIAPVGSDLEGRAFNVNADWAAMEIAVALGVSKVIFLTDQEGILSAERALIPTLDAAELECLIERGTVTGGMLAKTRTILHGLRSGVSEVHVLNASRPQVLIEELFTNHGVGTLCQARARVGAALSLGVTV